MSQKRAGENPEEDMGPCVRMRRTTPEGPALCRLVEIDRPTLLCLPAKREAVAVAKRRGRRKAK